MQSEEAQERRFFPICPVALCVRPAETPTTEWSRNPTASAQPAAPGVPVNPHGNPRAGIRVRPLAHRRIFVFPSLEGP